MIKATMRTGDGAYVLILGLSRENTKRLHEGRPIYVDAHETDDRLPELQIVVLAGDTEASIAAELQNALDQQARR